MNCPSCGEPITTAAEFCPACLAAVPAAPGAAGPGSGVMSEVAAIHPPAETPVRAPGGPAQNRVAATPPAFTAESGPPSPPESPAEATVPADEPSGFGGWLLLPLLGLIISPVLIVASVVTDILPTFEPQVWEVLTTPGTEAYHWLYAPLLIFELVANTLLVIGTVVIAAYFFRAKSVTPKLMVGLYLARLAVIGIDTLVAQALPLDEKVSDELVTDLLRTALQAAIWVPYFLTSKRVKNTFVR